MRYTVHHCLLASVVHQHRAGPTTSDILGVDYHLTVAADVEFPKQVSRLELFVRFVAHAQRPIRCVITVTPRATAL